MFWVAEMAAESLVCLLNSLERATHLAKCLPTATNHHEIATVYASLRDAHQNIHNFLLLQQQQQQPNIVASIDEDSILSNNDAVVGNNNGFLRGENVQEMEEGEDQQMRAMEGEEELKKLQESIKDVCALQNKRRKRALSPSSVELCYVKGDQAGGPVFKPQDHQRNFDLIFQFHG